MGSFIILFIRYFWFRRFSWIHRHAYSEDRPSTTSKTSQFNESSTTISGDGYPILSDLWSVILRTSCRLLYHVPRSIRSPHIEIFQTGLRSLTSFNFRSASDIAQWFDKFLEHAMLINMQRMSLVVSLLHCMMLAMRNIILKSSNFSSIFNEECWRKCCIPWVYFPNFNYWCFYSSLLSRWVNYSQS